MKGKALSKTTTKVFQTGLKYKFSLDGFGFDPTNL